MIREGAFFFFSPVSHRLMQIASVDGRLELFTSMIPEILVASGGSTRVYIALLRHSRYQHVFIGKFFFPFLGLIQTSFSDSNGTDLVYPNDKIERLASNFDHLDGTLK